MIRRVAIVVTLILLAVEGQPILAPAARIHSYGGVVVPGLQLDSDLVYGTRPKITRVSEVFMRANPTIVIKGRNLGTYEPYNGDSNYLKLLVDPTSAPGWAAGCGPADGGPCGTTINVTSWRHANCHRRVRRRISRYPSYRRGDV